MATSESLIVTLLALIVIGEVISASLIVVPAVEIFDGPAYGVNVVPAGTPVESGDGKPHSSRLAASGCPDPSAPAQFVPDEEEEDVTGPILWLVALAEPPSF